jgi:hypothetical protein
MGYRGWFGETQGRFEYVFIPHPNVINPCLTATHKQGDVRDRVALTFIKGDRNNLFLGEGDSLAMVLARGRVALHEFDHAE